MSSKERIELFTLEDHSSLFCAADSPPGREEWEAIEMIGAVLCDLFYSLYYRPVSACYAHVNGDFPRSFAFETYYPSDFQTAGRLREFFNVLSVVSDELPVSGIVVSKEHQVVSAARFSDYVDLVVFFLGSVEPSNGQCYTLRAFPEDIRHLVNLTDAARYGKKNRGPFLLFPPPLDNAGQTRALSRAGGAKSTRAARGLIQIVCLGP
ncbi:MAG: hypothetical protein H6862_00685 [Rhodospirillales bacterium]|nr:hypothetical protein [Rhodospirillales bacterium]